MYWEIIWIVFSENNEMFGVTSYGINSFGWASSTGGFGT